MAKFVSAWVLLTGVVFLSSCDSARTVTAELGNTANIKSTLNAPCLWVKGTNPLREIPPNSRITFINTERWVFIRSTEIQDAGTWTCVTEENGMESVELILYKPPIQLGFVVDNNVYLNDEEEIFVSPNKNGDVRVDCKVAGSNPAPDEFIWTVDGKPVNSIPEIKLEYGSLEDNRLINATNALIFQLRNGHEDTLVTCSAKNEQWLSKEVKTISTLCRENVPITKLTISSLSPALFVGSAQPVLDVECNTDGVPVPEWYSFRWTDPITREMEIIGSSSRIMSVDRHGVYSCTTNLTDGRQFVSNDLMIYSDVEPQNHHRVKKDSIIILHCQKQADDQCYWLHDPLVISSHPKKANPDGYDVESDGTSCHLEIKSVEKKDEGSWLCASKSQEKDNTVHVINVVD